MTDDQLRQAHVNAQARCRIERQQTPEQIANLELLPPTSSRCFAPCSKCGASYFVELIRDGLCPPCVRRIVEARFARSRMMADSGIEPRHAGLATFDDLLTAAAAEVPEYVGVLKAFRGFLNSAIGSVLALVGERGTGKTQLAATAVREAIERGRPGRIIRTADVLEDQKRRWDDSAGGAAWVAEWSRPWLLVLDEFADRGDSDWSSRTLTMLIDRRYGQLRKTVLIANLRPSAFADLAGASVIDRCFEGGGIITCEWGSFRRQEAAHGGGDSEDCRAPF